MITYPTTLPLPMQQGYSIERNTNDQEINARSGTGIILNRSDSEPNLFSVQWLLNESQYKVLHDWFYNELNAGELEFTMPLWIESGVSEQTAVFVADSFQGYSTTENGLYSVSAQIFVPSLVDPDDGLYDLLVFGAENSSDGDPETFYDILDIAINEVLPTSNLIELIAFGRANTQPPSWQNYYATFDLVINEILPEV